MAPRMHWIPLLTQFVLVVLVAYLLHYATLPVPDDLNQRDTWMLRINAMGLDVWRLGEKFETPFRVPISNAFMGLLGAWGIRDVDFQDTVVDDVHVRIYEPKLRPSDPMAGMVYLHGGGWMYGSPRSYHGLTAYLASELRIVLMVVDYRNPPEHLFPAAIDDSTKATVWFLQNADQYHVDLDRIAAVGDSAGGNLAAAVTQRLTQWRNQPFSSGWASITNISSNFSGATEAPIAHTCASVAVEA